MKWIILLSCVVAFASAAAEINPDGELSSELRLAQKLLTSFTDGIPSLDIPPMDPFHTKNNLFEYKNGFLFGQIVIKSADLYGMSKAIVKNVKTKITKNELAGEFRTVAPEIFVEGLYKGKGEFNGLNLQSKGYFNITLTNVDVTTKFAGKFIERDGEKYFKVTKADMNPKVGDMKIFATGLFPDPALNEFVLNLANQYWRTFYDAMLPDARVYFKPILLQVADNFTMKVPVRQLLAGI